MSLTISELEYVKDLLIPEVKKQVIEEIKKEYVLVHKNDLPKPKQTKDDEFNKNVVKVNEILIMVKNLLPENKVFVSNDGVYRGMPITYAVAYVCRSLPKPINYAHIASFFKKNHSSIIFWTAQCEKLMEKNQEYRLTVHQIVSKLRSENLTSN